MLKKVKSRKGFTLVELLVVMAIIAVLIGLSVAGLAYAMRRSRNIARSAAMANLEKALTSYYDTNQKYPLPTTLTPQTLTATTLTNFLEGSWDGGPANSIYRYKVDATGLKYTICVSQEKTPSGTEYNCVGTGLASDASWPTKVTADPCTVCGTTSTWNGSGW